MPKEGTVWQGTPHCLSLFQTMFALRYDEALERSLPTTMIARVAEAVRDLAAVPAQAPHEELARHVLAGVESAFDDEFVTWCVVQGGAWLRSATALHWQARLERALLQRHLALDHNGSEDAINVMVESVSRASVDFLTTSVTGLRPSSRSSALAICAVVLGTAPEVPS